MDECLQICSFCIQVTFGEIDAAIECLLDESHLILPRCELNHELFEERLLVLTSQEVSFDQSAVVDSFLDVWDILTMASGVHLRVHNFKARHRVEEIQLGLAKHLAPRQIFDPTEDEIGDVFEIFGVSLNHL